MPETLHARLRILVFWFALAAPVFASGQAPQDPAATAPETAQDQSQETPVPPIGELEYRRFHRLLALNLTSNLFTRNNLVPFLIGAGGALAIAPADHEISRALRAADARTIDLMTAKAGRNSLPPLHGLPAALPSACAYCGDPAL